MLLNTRITRKQASVLSDALLHKELSLYYQPIIHTQDDEVVAIESLIRWNHPKLGYILPCNFIPLAEKTGLILAIGDWVLQSSCLQAKHWQTKGKAIRVCVNVSPRQFQTMDNDDHSCFLQSIEKALDESKLPPNLLEIEITESMMIKNLSNSINTIKKLKNLGIRIACDDFGTGYSTLNYLKYFPFDTIKIDKSFIDGITNNPIDIAIIRAIVLIAKQLNIAVVAEGVEHQAQINALNDIGCDTIQGYYFSKPVQSDKIDAILNHSIQQNKH